MRTVVPVQMITGISKLVMSLFEGVLDYLLGMSKSPSAIERLSEDSWEQTGHSAVQQCAEVMSGIQEENVILVSKLVKSPQQVSLVEDEGTLTQMSMDLESITEEDPVTIDAPLEMQLVDNTNKQTISRIPHFDLWEYTTEQPGEQVLDPNTFRTLEHCIYTIFFLVYYINQLNCGLRVDLLCSDIRDKRSLAIEAMSIKVNSQISKRLAKLVDQANNLPKYYDTITEDIDPTRYYMWCNMLYKIAHEIGFEINTAIPQRHLGRPRKNSLTMNNRLLSCTYNTNTFNEPNILQLGSLWYETVLEHDPNKEYHNK